MTARAIFITGGASGIGLAVAKHFAAQGWRVGLADVNGAGLDAAAAGFAPDSVTTHVMDVRDRAAWASALTDFTEAGGGRLDAMFNNAGIGIGGPFAQTSYEDIDRILDINLVGVVNGAHAAYPFLKATPGSCLINTASAAAIYGSAGLALYAATKFAVRGFSESLDGEWAPDGIKVRVLMPSFIDTPILDTISPGTNQTARETVRERGLEFTPLEVVAQAVWDSIERDQVHILVGKTARRLAFAQRWMPKMLRREMRVRFDSRPGG